MVARAKEEHAESKREYPESVHQQDLAALNMLGETQTFFASHTAEQREEEERQVKLLDDGK